MTEIRFTARAKDFSLLHSVNQIGGYGIHPASYQRGPGAISQGLKPSMYEAQRSPPSSAEIENGVAILPLPNTSLCHCAYFIKHNANFTFT
jgi:hypothetical protein